MSSAVARLRDAAWTDVFSIAAASLGDPAPWKNVRIVTAALAGAVGTDRTLLLFFAAGEPVDANLLDDALGKETVEFLLKAGVIRWESAGKLASEYMLVRAAGLTLFASWRAGGRGSGSWDPLIGPDSVMFAQLVAARRPGVTVDLGCGTGIIGLSAARNGSDVLSVDISETCVAATNINASVNGLADRVRAVRGDFTIMDFQDRFDLVCSNPPFFPAPYGSLRFTAGESGLDGLDLVRRIMQRVPDLLAAGGEGLILAAGYGDSTGPFMLAEFEQKLARLGLSGKLFLMKSLPARWTVFAAQGFSKEPSARAISSEIGQFIRRIGATHYYPFMLAVQHSSHGHSPHGHLAVTSLTRA